MHNPFSPGAGSPPPELAGRDALLQRARIMLGRIAQGRNEQSMMLVGLRGVGKTVLLNRIREQAERLGFSIVMVEATESRRLPELLAPGIRQVLFQLDMLAGVNDRVKRGLRVLRSFIGALKIKAAEVEFGLGINAEKGTADSGDLEADLPELLAALGEAAKARGKAVAIIEWGYQSWNLAGQSPIDVDVVKEATAASIQKLDESFFRVRFDRLTPREKAYMRAVAGLGTGSHRSGDIADCLKVQVRSIAPLRSGLIKKGMIYSPAHGDTAFTVPLFDEYMRRSMPNWSP